MEQKKQELGEYLFHQGTNYTAYAYMGCHRAADGTGKVAYTFRTWAPNAASVHVVGDFSDWKLGIPMRRISEGGIWELVYVSDEPLEGKRYKYRVESRAGVHLKGDPYAFYSMGRDDGATVIVSDVPYKWQDGPWLDHRRDTVCSRDGRYLSAPVNIYEVHLGSFMRDENGEYLNYRTLGDKLAAYTKRMGYTHVELLPVTEYPYDGSWGYQVCGFFAPTSRFGEPDDFRYFVDVLHRAGVGVLLDWVPAHFPKDEWGLYEFDGGPLYEYQGYDRMESRSWGTRFFDLGRQEIQSFLVSSALYWLREFHIDGLRVDAVASMLYLDYDRMPGEWFPNVYGGNHNLEAIAFLQKLNSAVFGEFPDVLMIAEESTAFAGVTHPVSEGGLGFNLKWNMGWANDFYEYLSLNPVYRKYHHSALNFPLMYAFGENYVLPISHDEVVHGKKSFIDKMHGSYGEKFAQVRAALMLQMTYPGKKMLFMGTEFGQFREWDYASSLEWFMLNYPAHAALSQYVAALNDFYLRTPALWEQDFVPDGFRWILPDDADQNLVAYTRVAADGAFVHVCITFSGVEQTVALPAEKGDVYEIVFETDGDGSPREPLRAAEQPDGSYAVSFTMHPLSGVMFRPCKRTSARRRTRKA